MLPKGSSSGKLEKLYSDGEGGVGGKGMSSRNGGVGGLYYKWEKVRDEVDTGFGRGPERR